MAKRMTRKLHAIQLESIKVIELFIRSNQAPDPNIEPQHSDFSLSNSHNPYDADAKRIRVISSVEIGMAKQPTTPYSMRVSLVGFFRVDDQEFDVAHIDDWADKNAPLILYPFLREHVFALSARCGFRPVLLPLQVVPTLIPKPRKKPTPSVESDSP
jgi:preprotein translocase subunit SecB